MDLGHDWTRSRERYGGSDVSDRCGENRSHVPLKSHDIAKSRGASIPGRSRRVGHTPRGELPAVPWIG